MGLIQHASATHKTHTRHTWHKSCLGGLESREKSEFDLLETLGSCLCTVLLVKVNVAALLGLGAALVRRANGRHQAFVAVLGRCGVLAVHDDPRHVLMVCRGVGSRFLLQLVGLGAGEARGESLVVKT